MKFKINPLLLATSLVASVSAPAVHAADGSWNVNADGNWSTSGNWSSTIADGVGFTATFGNDITADRVITLDGPRTLGNITFGDATPATAGSWTISGSTLTLDRTSGSPTITVNTLATGKTATISSVIAGSDGLTVAGVSSLNLAGANTFTGGVNLNGSGRTFISNTNAAQTWTISNATHVAGILVSNSGAFASGSILNITATSTGASGFGIADNTAGIVGAGSTINISGGGRSAFQLGTGTNLGANIIQTSTSRLQFQIGDTATISGNITFNTAGQQMNIRHDSNTISQMTGTTRSNGTLTISGNLISSVAGAGSIAEMNSFSGTLILSGENKDYSGSISTTGNAAGGSTLSFSSTGKDSTGAADLSKNNLGTGALNIGGGSNVGMLTYTGSGSTVTNTLNLSGTTGGTTITQNGTGQLKLTSIATTGTGIKTVTLQGSTAGNGEISGIIADKDGTNKTSLTKAGTGTWTLSGANTYTGTTTVNGGTLVVNGSLGTTSTTIGSSGRLAGNGTIGGTVGVNGTLSPGNSIGTLNFSQTLTLTGIADFEIDPTLGTGLNRAADLANASGAVAYGGVLNILYGGSSTDFADGMVFNLFDGASFSGSFSEINLPDLTGTGLSWQDNLATNGSLTVIPEPSSALLGSIGMLLLFRRRWPSVQ